MTTRINEAWVADSLLRERSTAFSGSSSIAESRDQTYAEERWREITNLLLGWRTDVSKLEAEEIDPPTPDVIDQALRTVAWLREQGQLPPDRVVPCPDAGIAFEWYQEPWDFDLELTADGRVTWAKYFEHRAVERHRSTWKPR